MVEESNKCEYFFGCWNGTGCGHLSVQEIARGADHRLAINPAPAIDRLGSD